MVLVRLTCLTKSCVRRGTAGDRDPERSGLGGGGGGVGGGGGRGRGGKGTIHKATLSLSPPE